ncbi:MAG: signal recognition particle protein, partial [Lachnospiraceae bacterium]|nr:signal recognition particle protein [Lachnospiraceae bacterium]
VGTGEKMTDIEQFYPDRMASRILGMGDILTLIDKAEAQFNEEKSKELEKKIRKAEFDFNDYLEQIDNMRNMGGLSQIMEMLPGMGMGNVNIKDVDTEQGEKGLKVVEAIIHSMTAKERANPDLLNPSRKNRIAKGAGVDVAEVNRMVKQFYETRKMMKQMSGLFSGKKKGRFKLPFGLGN